MTPEIIQQAIKIAQDYSTDSSNPISITFFGGEPLLKRDLIIDTIRHCHMLTHTTGQDFIFRMTTNGLLLDESFLVNEATAKVFIALSHDGVQAMHDANRVFPTGVGSFELLSLKLKMALKYKPYTPVMMIINPETVDHYFDSLQFLYQQGFRYIIATMNYLAKWEKPHFAALKRQYQQIAQWYYSQSIAEAKFYYSPFETKISAYISGKNCRFEQCELGRNQISVAPNGRLYPCVQFVGDGSDTSFAIGSVDNGIDQERQRRLYRQNEKQEQACQQCAIRERCNHYCACVNYLTTGRLNGVSPALCEHERMLLPIIDQLANRLYKERNAMFIQKHYNEYYPFLSLAEDNG
jgi:uncharacterized protein